MISTWKILDFEPNIHYEYIHSVGPGGQNVNKTSTAVLLSFDLNHTSILTDQHKERLRTIAKNRIGASGELLILARRFRSQTQNRTDAQNRLLALIDKSSRPVKPRLATKPKKSSINERLKKKRIHSLKKVQRKFKRDSADE